MWEKFAEYGLVGIMIGIILFILWRMIIWVMAFVKEQAAQHAAERKCWQTTMDKNSEVISKIVASVDRHDEKADERGKYVREEHRQMIEVLGRINGYKKE
jgi:flagellar biosynthesis/type III secretory pathway M-ring protein FliF/YscJ